MQHVRESWWMTSMLITWIGFDIPKTDLRRRVAETFTVSNSLINMILKPTWFTHVPGCNSNILDLFSTILVPPNSSGFSIASQFLWRSFLIISLKFNSLRAQFYFLRYSSSILMIYIFPLILILSVTLKTVAYSKYPFKIIMLAFAEL